ncbi:lamin tail domain-containing protein [Brumimicrobium aurantiacum]|uniref:T9SS C-terminal target domain-containing protein n=1 Tax=Brumimicrobium aurantiacum TaxID=1737063 RepID=A0A3E1EUS1_9FLAO|nr:lamin tail domain-containing protein [Brumimicrobium aurantiacum]RFC53280.1 T9SS C-terminal target domain-containing protein [Brumimicrobium aurantiacum]
MKKFYIFMLTVVMLILSSALKAQDIVITEIMYNPPESGQDSLEFIELYNNDNISVDLNGWSFSQGVSHTFGTVTMNPGEYLVVAVDAAAIQNVFGYSTAIEWTSGGLSNGGEDIILVDGGGATIDVVDFDDGGVWPSGSSAGNPDGGGASLVLCDPNSDNDNGINWIASTSSTNVITNGKEVLGSPGAADNGCLSLCNTVSSFTEVACASYTVPSGDEVYTTSGTYMDTIPNAAGCDSVMTIDLTINPVAAGTDVQVACGSYTWIDGITYTASNTTATHTIVGGATNGCDSIVTLDLTINPVAVGTDVQVACGSYTWIDGMTYTASNTTATHTIVGGAANGCDSIVTLDLTINLVATGTDVQVACGSFTWIDGMTYTASNTTATHTIVGGAVNGCDSIVTLDLTINNSVTGTDVQVACGSYTWIDGITYTASNTTATHTIVGGAANGCDSIVILDLTINLVATGTDVQVACGSYTWIDGITYTASNTTATHTIVGGAANGCDSIVTLDLTINNFVTGTDVQVACGSFTWIDGMTYTASNTTATHTIVGGAVNGCDSIVTLDLTINNSVTGTDVQVACGSYTWIDGITYTASNTTATHTIVGGAANGCDSIVTLDLTINNFVTGTDVQVACGSFTWIDGMTYTASNTTATHTIVGGAVNGCDSIVTLDLTINPTNEAGVDVVIFVCMNEPIDLDTLSALGNVGSWLDESNNSVMGVVTFAATGSYDYKYIVATSGNCPADTAIYTIDVDGTCDYLSLEKEAKIEVSVYPNPVSSVLTITNYSGAKTLKMELVDMNGRVVLVENNLFNSTDKETISMESLQEGFYTLRIYNGSIQKSFKVVKQ